MDIVGLFEIGNFLLSALVELGVFVYDFCFVPLREYLPSLDIPFVSDIIEVIPPEIWSSLLGDFSLGALFISSGAIIYVVINFVYTVLKFFDILT